MEELKELINMVANIPSMALWVIAAFWAYKVIVIGSVYGLIRFSVEKIHSYLMKTREPKPAQDIVHKIDLGGIVITGDKESMLAQLSRLKNISKHNIHRNGYIWDTDVEWLAQAITDKLHKDLENKVKENNG